MSRLNDQLHHIAVQQSLPAEILEVRMGTHKCAVFSPAYVRHVGPTGLHYRKLPLIWEYG